MLPALPAILGNGVGGTVAGAGSGVEAGAPGRGQPERHGRVRRSRSGARPRRLIEIPGGMPLRDAVALLADGRTALALVAGRACGRAIPSWSRPRPAAWGRCWCSSRATPGPGSWRWPASRASSRSRGISGPTWPSTTAATAAGTRVRDAIGEVDVVFDGVGGDIGLAAFGLLATGGRFCPFGMASGRFARVTPELAQARQVTIRADAAASPEELAALVRTALAEAAAGRLRPVIGQEFVLAASRRRARGDRGQDDGRQDAADGAPVTAAWSGAGEGTAGVDRSPFGLMILIFVTISLYERLYSTVPPPAPSDWRHPAQFRRIVRDPRAWDDMHRTCRSRT